MTNVSYLIQRSIERPFWAIAFVLSIAYGIGFFLVATDRLPNQLLFGFCVWGRPEMPNNDVGCDESRPENSHMVSFVVEMIGLLIVVGLHILDENGDGGPKTFTFSDTQFRSRVWSLFMGGAFLIHGILHLAIQASSPLVNCYLSEEDVTERIFMIGLLIYGVYGFILFLGALGAGGGSFTTVTVASAVIFAIIFVNIVSMVGVDLLLPALFVCIHPVACGVGLINPSRNVLHIWTALFMCICTSVGLVELFSCEDFLVPKGGHWWYDVTLAMAQVVTLPYFWPADNIKSKNN